MRQPAILRQFLCIIVALGFFESVEAAERPRVLPVSRMSTEKDFTLSSGAAQILPEGPNGEQVAKFDSRFALRFDLARHGADLHAYDLLKLQVKADAHAFLVVSLENFPDPGQLSHWYVLDSAREELPWRTIWIDLKKPEEIKPAGSYKGMAQNDPQARGLHLRGNVTETRRSQQGPGRSIWLGEIRFVRKTIDIDWDQAQAPYDWSPGQKLVFRYPLTLRNLSDKPVTAALNINPVTPGEADADLAQTHVTLQPGAAKTVEARVSLPADIAAKSPPLYCERFDVTAAAEGQPDSDVTILRSSDVIPLSVTVPIADDKLQFPLLSRVSSMPEAVTGFTQKVRAEAQQAAANVSPDDLSRGLGDKLALFDVGYGFTYHGKAKPADDFRSGLTACAFLYDFTGDRRYLEKGTQLLLRAAELFPRRRQEWSETPYSPISHGIFATSLLQTGWATGSMRWPYCYERHGIFNDFDLLARDMEPAARDRIIREFLVPAAIQMRNHYFGLTNQQDVVNYPVMYAGLVSRNWPLVSHAYDSSHGVLNQIKYNFDDDGMATEGNYHKPSIEPILYVCELLRPRGIDLYDRRLHDILHSPAAAAIKKGYDSPMLQFAEDERFAATAKQERQADGGTHLATGTTVLRWEKLEVSMNWGVQQNRSAPDRCSLRINDLGGGNYTHSSLGQSIIIVDENRQDPRPATVRGFDIEGPVQFVCATSDAHYPGSSITRTFALLGEGVLVLDRVRNDRPRNVDWCLKGAGEHVDFKLTEVPGGFTRKPDDTAQNTLFGSNLPGNRHFSGTIDDAWSEGNGRLMMAGQPGTRVYSFRVPSAFSAGKSGKDGVPVLMVRRTNVRDTDFVTFFSRETRLVERVPVTTADGAEADALGARITLRNGNVFHALVNYQPGTEVQLAGLRTKALFATDIED